MKRVLFAAGGTMGHLGPAIAVARAVKEMDSSVEIRFVGTRSGIENAVDLEFPQLRIIKVPLPRKLGVDTLLFPFKLLIAVAQSLPLARSSDCVIGFGGYVATPIFIAARILGRRIILHEANALPGFANRLGKALGAECFANFEQIGKAWSCRTIGMPLRNEIVELAHLTATTQPRNSEHRIVVMGGSQGSMRINEVIWKALPSLKPSLRILHAVGERNLSDISHIPERAGYQAVGYIDSMAEAYRDADLIIARAGAVTCAEILALGKRAILIPLAHGNGEQRINADALVKEGLAVSVDDSEFTSEWLIAHIDQALALEPRLSKMRRLDATRILAEAILRKGETGL